MSRLNAQCRLAARPVGLPKASDWDYVIQASSRTRHSVSSSLPGSTTLDRIPSAVDILAGPLDTSLPYITFLPR